jgi:thioredoxin 1
MFHDAAYSLKTPDPQLKAVADPLNNLILFYIGQKIDTEHLESLRTAGPLRYPNKSQSPDLSPAHFSAWNTFSITPSNHISFNKAACWRTPSTFSRRREEKHLASPPQNHRHPSTKPIIPPTKEISTMSPIEIQSSLHFHTLLTSTPHLVADFFATWCPPCKAIAPIFQQLSAAHARPGSLLFVKVNVDQFPDLAARYGVTAMPTFVAFEGGKPMEGQVLRGADVGGLRRLVDVVVKAGEKKMEEQKSEEKEESEEKREENEEKTVSGSYGMTSGSGWRMKV